MTGATTTCEIWPGAKDRAGYPLRRVAGRTVLAHRHAWTQLHGAIPHGLEIDHTCGNPSCMNPDHMELVTHAENVRRGYQRRNGDACGRGHPWTPETTLIWSDGRRRCRTCANERRRKACPPDP